MRTFFRLFLGLAICLLLGAITLWLLRLPITTAALRHAGLTEPRIKSLQFVWPNSLVFKSLSGGSDGGQLLVKDGNLKVSGWRMIGKDLILGIDDALWVLPEKFVAPIPEPSGKTAFDPFSWLPAFSLTLHKLTVIPQSGAPAWGDLSGELKGGAERDLRISADTIAGDFELTSRIQPGTGEARIQWHSQENPDWNEVFPYLRTWGLAVPEKISADWSAVKASVDAQWGRENSGSILQLQCETLHLEQGNLSLRSEPIHVDLQATVQETALSFSGNGQTTGLSITADEDHLQLGRTEASIQATEEEWGAQIQVDTGEASLSKVEISAITASLAINRNNRGDWKVKAEGTAQAFSGSIETEIEAKIAPFSSLRVLIDLAEVSLGQINERFQFFDGVIEAQVQGHLQAEWKDGLLTILPSKLEMVPGTKGILQYDNPGWMTKNPDLDLKTLAEELRIDQLLRRSDGAGILVELAARNLTVTQLRISLFDEDQKDREGEIFLEGFSMVQKTKIPVVLTIPLRGDLQESIRLLIQASGVM